MVKKTILTILLELIFVILFNVIFFMVGGTEHEASVWISYGDIGLITLSLIAILYAILRFALWIVALVLSVRG